MSSVIRTMFSYLHGIRPNARRPPSDHSERGQSASFCIEDEDDHVFKHHQPDSDSSRQTQISSRPPILPPIPRVASQHRPSQDPPLQQTIDSRNEHEETAQDDELNEAISSPPPPSYPPPDIPKFPGQNKQTEVRTLSTMRNNYSRPFQRPVSYGNLKGSSVGDSRPSHDPRSLYSPSTMDVVQTNNLLQNQQPHPHLIQPKQPPPPLSSESTSVVHRSSKPKLNRLNPMSLLSRRRTSQAAGHTINESSSDRRNMIPGTTLPDDYDPRIRGNVVHDFSAPRPRGYPPSRGSALGGPKTALIGPRKLSSDSDHNTLRLVKSDYSDQTIDSDRQYTPVFKEHFGDDIDTWRLDELDRRNQETTGIIDRVPADEPTQRRSPLPPFARHLPDDVSDPMSFSNATYISPSKIIGTNSSQSWADYPQDHTTKSRSPPASPPKEPSSITPVLNAVLEPGGLPKHFKSNASRFSFDLAGVGSSAQEKLLEDKHRQKNAQRTRSSTISSASVAEAEDEGYDYDDMDFDEGLEEKIPGVNADDENQDYEEHGAIVDSIQTVSSGLMVQPDTDRLLRNQVPPARTQSTFDSSPFYSISNSNFQLAAENGPASVTEGPLAMAINGELPNTIRSDSGRDDDDLYFDDGMIEDEDLQQGLGIDESLFDDDANRVYGRPLRDQQPMPLVPETDMTESSGKSTRPISLESGVLAHNQGITADTSRTSVQPPEGAIVVRKSSLLQEHQEFGFDQSAGLTQDNLAAYHGALALAANRAAREGRFDRKGSLDEGTSQVEEGQKRSHVSFGELPPGKTPASTDKNDFEETTGFAFDDDDLDDDAIIAAANAEALENDDEGFYGREFGFFAHSSAGDEADYANGGYFGPGGPDSIKRSHSGRVNGQEPSLTPITERSEWSQRNSMISLAMNPSHGSYPQASQTPGLAQLADALQYEEDNMSLSALMKLRRGAWGGSEVSLHSNGSHKSASAQPFGFQSPPSTSMPPPPSRNSAHFSSPAQSFSVGSPNSVSSGLLSSEPDAHALAGSAHNNASFSGNALRLSTQDLVGGPFALHRPASSGSVDRSPVRRSGAVKGHSRESSGAESVSYVEEGGRWVVEKRKMGDGGVVEVLGRQVVEGGRI